MESKKYSELYRQIKDKITSGEYKSGEKLPSKRVTADHFGCSVITVEKAYGMLADEGYIFPKERSGYFVGKLDLPYTGIHKAFDNRIAHIADDVSPPHGEFEHSVWFKTIRKVISESGEKLFVKSPGKGCAVLRNAISDYLLRYRGMSASPERIIIGSGSEQLYETVVKILGRNRVYGIENPSYSQIEAVYKSYGVTLKKLKLEKDGIRNDTLKEACVDVLHVTPFRSYPTDVTVGVSKRYEYLSFAGDGRYIVEDDFNSEFFKPGHPVEPLYSLDTRGVVIYMNTFSKSLSPSMRMGYMILPESLMDEYDRKLGMFSCSVPVLDQYVLAEFISSGNFERHLNRMRRRMRS